MRQSVIQSRTTLRVELRVKCETNGPIHGRNNAQKAQNQTDRRRSQLMASG
jgi:hypothetical protein